MVSTVSIILGLVVAWFLGFEMGKWQMASTIRNTIRASAKQLEEMSKKLKQTEEKSNESTQNG